MEWCFLRQICSHYFESRFEHFVDFFFKSAASVSQSVSFIERFNSVSLDINVPGLCSNETHSWMLPTTGLHHLRMRWIIFIGIAFISSLVVQSVCQ